MVIRSAFRATVDLLRFFQEKWLAKTGQRLTASSRTRLDMEYGPASATGCKKFKTFAAQIAWWEDFARPQSEK
jgi:hypothetical protein